MIKIEVYNLQAISEAVITISENSITEFSGDNSNGKSIISKCIQAITSGDIRSKTTRRTLIKDGCDKGVFSITHDKEQMIVLIAEEISNSAIIYVPNIDDDKKITRPLSDKVALEKMTHKFGFRTYADGDICLQLSPTWGAIPFVTTNGKVNSEIIKDITIDKVAEDFLNGFKTITFPLFRSRIQEMEKEKEYIGNVLDSLEAYDWKAYDALRDKIIDVLDVIQGYTYFQLEPLDIPNFDVQIIEEVKLESIVREELIQPVERLLPIGSMNDLITIMNGTCPTCGKSLVD